jgi:uncharacterized OB-fold protein
MGPTERVPYNVALIELDEGQIMLSNVIAVDNATLEDDLATLR